MENECDHMIGLDTVYPSDEFACPEVVRASSQYGCDHPFRCCPLCGLDLKDLLKER